MQIILLSGGSGRRLWPLAGDERSKQFVKFLKDENGEPESMLRRVYGQIARGLPDAQLLIAASEAQVSEIHAQLGEKIEVCAEPCRRDTFPAIALSCAYLHDVKGLGKDEPIIVCPVDPLVEADYFAAFRVLKRAAENRAGIVLMGIEPTYPSEKYGYILPEDAGKVSAVRCFHEKPDSGTAESYLRAGALWNGGVFAFQLGYMLERMRELTGFVNYKTLLQNYSRLERISFDRAVAERENSMRVVRFSGAWRDLGTWNTLTEAMPKNVLGNAVLDETCKNVHVINELPIPVLCMGLRNVVVTVTAQGILVADKAQSSRIKPYAEQLERSKNTLK